MGVGRRGYIRTHTGLIYDYIRHTDYRISYRISYYGSAYVGYERQIEFEIRELHAAPRTAERTRSMTRP